MSKLEEQFAQDRALRDEAKSVLMADIEHARTTFSAKGVAGRVGTRIGDGAIDVYEQAKDKAGRNGGVIAALVGFLILWLGREPLMEALGRVVDKVEAELDDDLSAPDAGNVEQSDQPLAEPSEPDNTTSDADVSPSSEPPGDNDEQ